MVSVPFTVKLGAGLSVQVVPLLGMLQLACEVPFLYSPTLYPAVVPIAVLNVKDAGVEMVPAVGVVLHWPAVWLAQLAETDTYQMPEPHDWNPPPPL